MAAALDRIFCPSIAPPSLIGQLQYTRLEVFNLCPSKTFTIAVEVNSLTLWKVIRIALEQSCSKPARAIRKQSDNVASVGEEVLRLVAVFALALGLEFGVAIVAKTVSIGWALLADYTRHSDTPYSIAWCF